MRMTLERVSGPAEADILALVTVDEVKRNKRVRNTLEDDLFKSYILDAFAHFDGPNGWLRRGLLPQVWRGTVDTLSTNEPIELPLAPFRSLVSVSYRDDAGAWQVLDPALYEVVPRGTFHTLERALNAEWPYVTRRAAGVRVEFEAGYTGASGADPTPWPILRAIKLLAGSLYEHREADIMDNRVTEVSRKIEYGIEEFAGPYRIPLDLVD